MELKDLITPLVTLTGVWLAARFTLRNEISKKALEIRTSRLETLSSECTQALYNVSNYLNTLCMIVESKYMLLHERYPQLSESELQVPAIELARWKDELDDSDRKLKTELLDSCRSQLSFHHPHERIQWEYHVTMPLVALENFFFITSPTGALVDMKGKSRSKAEALAITADIKHRANEQLGYVQQMTRRFADEFYQLTQPQKTLTLKDYIGRVRDKVKHFFFG